MKRSKIAIICIGFALSLGAAACSGRKDIPKINMENMDNGEIELEDDSAKQDNFTEEGSTQNNSSKNNTIAIPDSAPTNNGDSSNELFVGAKLQGSVVECSDTEISLSIATTASDENGGEIMAEAAPGMENEDELVHITYGENLSVRILTMDSSSQKQISLEASDKGSIKKGTSVLIFGEGQDTYHWTANEVVIVRWQ